MNLEKINEILANKHVLLVIITIIISIVILKVKSRIFNKAIKKVGKTKDKGYRKVITYIKLTNHIINYIIIIIATSVLNAKSMPEIQLYLFYNY